MTILNLSMVREIKEKPDRVVELARQVGPLPEVAVLQQFDILVFCAFAEFIVCRLWGGLEAFCTSLVHASRHFALPDDDPRVAVVRQWPVLLRLGQMLGELARDERALDLVMTSRDMQEILRVLGAREPLASEDLRAELGKTPQNLCNLLRQAFLRAGCLDSDPIRPAGIEESPGAIGSSCGAIGV
jgi:hypothetical protein